MCDVFVVVWSFVALCGSSDVGLLVGLSGSDDVDWCWLVLVGLLGMWLSGSLRLKIKGSGRSSYETVVDSEIVGRNMGKSVVWFWIWWKGRCFSWNVTSLDIIILWVWRSRTLCCGYLKNHAFLIIGCGYLAPLIIGCGFIEPQHIINIFFFINNLICINDHAFLMHISKLAFIQTCIRRPIYFHSLHSTSIIQHHSTTIIQLHYNRSPLYNFIQPPLFKSQIK